MYYVEKVLKRRKSSVGT
jgi:hypothetical protein